MVLGLGKLVVVGEGCTRTFSLVGVLAGRGLEVTTLSGTFIGLFFGATTTSLVLFRFVTKEAGSGSSFTTREPGIRTMSPSCND
jgi:hypothetical protein